MTNPTNANVARTETSDALERYLGTNPHCI